MQYVIIGMTNTLGGNTKTKVTMAPISIPGNPIVVDYDFSKNNVIQSYGDVVEYQDNEFSKVPTGYDKGYDFMVVTDIKDTYNTLNDKIKRFQVFGQKFGNQNIEIPKTSDWWTVQRGDELLVHKPENTRTYEIVRNLTIDALRKKLLQDRHY